MRNKIWPGITGIRLRSSPTADRRRWLPLGGEPARRPHRFETLADGGPSALAAALSGARAALELRSSPTADRRRWLPLGGEPARRAHRVEILADGGPSALA